MTFRASAGFTSDWQHVRVEAGDGVLTVTLARPERLNALTFDVYADASGLAPVVVARGTPASSVPIRVQWHVREGPRPNVVTALLRCAGLG